MATPDRSKPDEQLQGTLGIGHFRSTRDERIDSLPR